MVDWGFIFITLIFVAAFTTNHWAGFPLSTFAICFVGYIFYKNTWTHRFGFFAPRCHTFLAIGLFCCLFVLFNCALSLLCEYLGIQRVPYPNEQKFFWGIILIFQVVNEEIVLRALLLSKLSLRLRSDNLATAIGAAVFCFVHFLLYTYLNDTPLNLLALFSLLIFCFIVNQIYLHTKHIYFSFALHAAWNINRFTASYWSNQNLLTEAESFNIIEGVIWPGLLLLLISIYRYWKKPPILV